MPKYRTTPTELTENPDMVNGGIEVSGVLFWLALLVDDEGRAILDSAALARRFNIEREVFERGLSYLVEHEFLQVYQAGRYHYYQILRWERWQNLSEKTKTPSKYPAPPQETRPDAIPETPVFSPGNPGQSGEPLDKRREGEEKKNKENPREDDEAQPPPNVLLFPAARADATDAAVVSEKMMTEVTKQVAAILKLPVTDDLGRVVVDYLGCPGLSLLGEADAAAEWIADPTRNHKRQHMTPAFFRRWLKRETETTGHGSPTPSARAPGAVSTAAAQPVQSRLAASGAGPPGAPPSPDNPYRAYVNQRAEQLLAEHAVIAYGTSGGKDSSAMALATNAYLDQIGHRGPRLLIHSDLGRIEWQASLPMSQRLADRLGLELVVVRRQAGDLLDRWRQRWQHNIERYRALLCVKLILPWSTARMRFCTSELKTALICRALIERFPGHTILSVSGIRREESSQRRYAPIVQAQPRLTNASHQTRGYDWHPLADWTLEDVLAFHKVAQFPLHEAYITYGSSRVSCAFCILGSRADLVASASCADHQGVYHDLVELEIASTFSFQDRQWLGDIAPHLLEEGMRTRLQEAKRRAGLREEAEALIPRHLLYCKGWPTVLPTRGEADLLADVRCHVAEIMDFPVNYTQPDAILDRYTELMTMSTRRKGNASPAYRADRLVS